MFEPSTQDKVRMLLNAPMLEWSDLQHGFFDETRQECAQELDALIIRAARLRAYLEMRVHGTHHEGVKASNSLVAKIRKALGYTQAKDEISF